MKKLIHLVLLLLCTISSAFAADTVSYGVARNAAPVLNTPAFRTVFGGADGKTLKTDSCGQLRKLEFIALPGTIFTIRGEIGDGPNTVFEVETNEYASPQGARLYLDSRFVEITKEKPQQLIRTFPSKANIQSSLKNSIGSPYVWGGNLQDGVETLMDLYYQGPVPTAARKRLTLAGLDCSGLLYQATGGLTPRNTSQLVSFGRAVKVSGRSAKEIAGLLEPLDLIVWNGHILIVLDRGTIIESCLRCGKKGNDGVITTPLRKRLSAVMRTRRPADSWPSAGKQRNVFVVRRWFPE
jgi:hypothetical protein